MVRSRTGRAEPAACGEEGASESAVRLRRAEACDSIYSHSLRTVLVKDDGSGTFIFKLWSRII